MATDLALPRVPQNMPAYRWLYEALRSEILQGRLRPGSRLPSTREFARQYGLARGTIVNAFEQLQSEGYVEGSAGSGTYVSQVIPEKMLHVASPPLSKWSTQKPHLISQYARHAKLFSSYETTPIRAFRANLPALDLFPTALWAKIAARCVKEMTTQQLVGTDALGYFPLRRAVAEYVAKSRGVRCAPEQVVILSGVQEGLDLTARLLLEPEDGVCMENPGYPGARLVFQAMRAKILPVSNDKHGVAVQRLPRSKVRLIYVTPGHQFPLGTTMSLARRLQLLDWAKKSGAVIFEDDYDSEFRYVGRPIPAMQGLDQAGSVLYAGSFSKVLFPGLRLGYLVIPAGLVPNFEAMLSLSSRHAPILEQLVLAEFIEEGHFIRHLRRMRKTYAERLSILLEQARGNLSGLLKISTVAAGLQTTGWLEDEIDGESAARAAAERHVEVMPLSRYGIGRVVPHGLQLGFAALDGKEIRRGVRELAIALESLRKGARRRQN